MASNSPYELCPLSAWFDSQLFFPPPYKDNLPVSDARNPIRLRFLMSKPTGFIPKLPSWWSVLFFLISSLELLPSTGQPSRFFRSAFFPPRIMTSPRSFHFSLLKRWMMPFLRDPQWALIPLCGRASFHFQFFTSLSLREELPFTPPNLSRYVNWSLTVGSP